MPKLSKENQDVFRFYRKVSPYLGNGMGGCNMGAVESALRIYQIPEHYHEALTDRVTIIINAAREMEEKQKPAGK